MEDKHQKFSLTWFFRLFLNSQAVTFLLVTLLTFLTIFIFSKISFFIQTNRKLFRNCIVTDDFNRSFVLPIKSDG